MPRSDVDKRIKGTSDDAPGTDELYDDRLLLYAQKWFKEMNRPGAGVFTMDFCTLGMFIIDDIHFPAPRPPVVGIIGGAGSWAALGARLFRQPPSAELVGWVIHAGSDFPSQLENEIISWSTSGDIIRTPERLTTRGLNTYVNSDHRDFEYLCPKLRIDETVLRNPCLASKTYHLICSPSRCIELVKGILEKRRLLEAAKEFPVNVMKRPIFVWEPVPDSCVPSELLKCLEALKYVDVFSPNLDEFASFFDLKIDLSRPGGRAILEKKCKEMVALGFGIKPCAVVVRLGELGCLVRQLAHQLYFPAYYDPLVQSQAERVIDPTGGGNTFLGGFCIGLLTEPHPKGLTEFDVAAIYGSVAASFAIEQVGMPKLSYRKDDEHELWNGETVRYRMNEYQKKLDEEDLPGLSPEQLQKVSLYEPADSENPNGRMVRKGNASYLMR